MLTTTESKFLVTNLEFEETFNKQDSILQEIQSSLDKQNCNDAENIAKVVHQILEDTRRNPPCNIKPRDYYVDEERYKAHIEKIDDKLTTYIFKKQFKNPKKRRRMDGVEHNNRNFTLVQRITFANALPLQEENISFTVDEAARLKRRLLNDTEVENFDREVSFLQKMAKYKEIVPLYGSGKYYGKKKSNDNQCLNGILFLKNFPKKDMNLNLPDLIEIKNKSGEGNNGLGPLYASLFEALAALEKEEITHMDIKAQNILIEENPLHAVLCDFEFAFSFEDYEKEWTKFEPILQKGTIPYLSPERINYLINYVGAKRINHKADVWSTGIILYLLHYGAFPAVCTAVDALFASLNNFQKKRSSYSNSHLDYIKHLIKEVNEQRDNLAMIFSTMNQKAEKVKTIQNLDDLICIMLHPDPDRRPTGSEAMAFFKKINSEY